MGSAKKAASAPQKMGSTSVKAIIRSFRNSESDTATFATPSAVMPSTKVYWNAIGMMHAVITRIPQTDSFRYRSSLEKIFTNCPGISWDSTNMIAANSTAIRRTCFSPLRIRSTCFAP